MNEDNKCYIVYDTAHFKEEPDEMVAVFKKAGDANMFIDAYIRLDTELTEKWYRKAQRCAKDLKDFQILRALRDEFIEQAKTRYRIEQSDVD